MAARTVSRVGSDREARKRRGAPAEAAELAMEIRAGGDEREADEDEEDEAEAEEARGASASVKYSGSGARKTVPALGSTRR